MEGYILNIVLIAFTFVIIFLSVNLVLLINNRRDVSIARRIISVSFMTVANLVPVFLPSQYTLLVSFGITMAAMMLSYYFIVKNNVIQALVYTFTHLIISIICEFYGMFLMHVFEVNSSVSELLASASSGITLLRLATIFLLLLLNGVLLIFKKLNKKFVTTYSVKSYAIIIQVLLIMFLVIPNILYFDYNLNNMSAFMIIFNFVTAVAMIFYSIFSLKKQNELAMRVKEVEMLKLTGKSMEISLDKLREFKHDLPNFIQGLSGCSYMHNWDGIDEQIGIASAEYSICKTTPMLDNYFKCAPAFYGVFLAKIVIAEAKNIEVNLNVRGDVDADALKFPKINRVFGSLVDNALEAAAEAPTRKLDVKFYIENNAQKIRIRNTYKGPVDKEQILQKGFSSKEGHSGIGLYEVNRIVNANSRLSLETKVGEKFEQLLSIELRS